MSSVRDKFIKTVIKRHRIFLVNKKKTTFLFTYSPNEYQSIESDKHQQIYSIS